MPVGTVGSVKGVHFSELREQVKAQIAQRKVDKVLSQSCLTFQKWLLDESKTVGQLLGEKGNKVVTFVRFQVGDGVEAAA